MSDRKVIDLIPRIKERAIIKERARMLLEAARNADALRWARWFSVHH